MSTRSREGDWIELGRISGVFGVKGEVRVFLHNPESDLFDQPTEVVLVGPDGQRRPIVMRTRSGAGKRILGRIEGLTVREEAAALKDWRIEIARDALPVLEEDEYYVWQLQGAQVWVEERCVGRVVEVHTSGPVEFFEIALSDVPEPIFVPSLSEYVARVDPAAGTVHLHPDALRS